MEYRKEYERWLSLAVADSDLAAQLRGMGDADIEDAFYRDLAFGTGGLRGVIGAGTNRINVYTVAKATQGLANYLKKAFTQPEVVIGYDSRRKSRLFAEVTASVLAANGIFVHIWPELNPVPTVSFAVRYLKASAGVMITASHNPSEYNGYKVYGADGCQITTAAAAAVTAEIAPLDIFSDVRTCHYEEGVQRRLIKPIAPDVMTAYIEAVKQQSVLFGDQVDRDVSIVYSPLNGTGYLPVTRILREAGYTNITLVEEQRLPDGNFPTCSYPNPEIPEAMALGMEYAEKHHADLLLATDPDCDRVGIAVRKPSGEYVLLSGNETGVLLLDYICSQRVKHGKMPPAPVMIKTIVTTDLGERIAADYGVSTVNVLTGFKFIGEQIALLEQQGRADSYIFGFEESYGYLSGSYVRDKDAVNGAYLICEMFSYYHTRGIQLTDRLSTIYQKYGYYRNTLRSYEFKGSAGFAKMRALMRAFRGVTDSFAGRKVETLIDYEKDGGDLPKADVVKLLLENHASVILRPSGTEPKLKAYISVVSDRESLCGAEEQALVQGIEAFLAEAVS